MSRSKKIFAAFALVFLLLLIYVAYDFSSRTTFPGSGPSVKEQPEHHTASPGDSVSADTAR